MDFKLHLNDLAIERGDLVLCSDDKEAIGQAITIRLKTLAGEWFLDQNIGIPYLSAIFGHKRSERYIRGLIQPAVNAVPDLKETKKFNITIDNNRTAHISFVAVLGDGAAIPINQSIGI